MIGFLLFAVLPLLAQAQQCFNSKDFCRVGECCKDSTGKILNEPSNSDFWSLLTKGKIGSCSSQIGSEGEACDTNCRCGTGLLCAPNLLCKQCGSICQAEDVVNRLIQYYNIGCTCPPPTGSKAPKPTCRPFSSTFKAPVTLVNGVVVFPEF